MARVGCFLWMLVLNWLMMFVSAMVVLECGRNANWMGEMISCLVQWSIICWLIILSKIFPIIGSSEIGR